MVCSAKMSLLCAPATGAALSSALFLHRRRRRRSEVTPSSTTTTLLPVNPSALVRINPSRLRRRPIAAAFGGPVLQDACATALVVGGAYALVSTFDSLTRRNVIEQNLSRKLVHILSGLLFLASWPIFRNFS